jgi:hypothetical protein
MKTMNIKHTAKSSALKTAPLHVSGSGDSPLFPGIATHTLQMIQSITCTGM